MLDDFSHSRMDTGGERGAGCCDIFGSGMLTFRLWFFVSREDVGDKLPSSSGRQEDAQALSVLPKRIEK
jgi:hypothetical protein